MSKAFGSINHDMLLFKLRSLCVSPSALEWFKSYLKGRYQHVRIGVWFCLLSQLIMEFHRGPFLAPFCLLFIYINDLLTVPKFCRVKLLVMLMILNFT